MPDIQELLTSADTWKLGAGDLDDSAKQDPEDLLSRNPDELRPTKFNFHYLSDAKFRMWQDRGLQMLLTKWGLGEHMCVGKWRYEQNVRTRDDARHMIAEFFRSTSNRAALSALGISILSNKDPERDIVPEIEDISTKHVSMDLLEKLETVGAVGTGGHIRGRMDEYTEDGICINSLVREILFQEESELYDTYTPDERKEFLLRVFQHLVIGGATNQYEDEITEYLKATKAIYRDLLSVRKRESDGEVEVTSLIFEIKGLGEQNALFRKSHRTNFCYLIVDTLLRHVTMWKFNHVSAWA